MIKINESRGTEHFVRMEPQGVIQRYVKQAP